MKRIACTLFGIALLIGMSVSAQGNSLSAADAMLLTQANSSLNSFAFQYTAHVDVTGLDTFAMSADLSGSGALDRTQPAFDVSLDGNLALGSAQQIPVKDEFRWLNDTLYLNAGEDWQAQAGAAQYAADLVSQYAFVTADATALGKWDLSGIDGVKDMMAALTSGDSASFLSVQRLADDSASKTAHFQVSADLPKLIQSDAFADAAVALAQAQGTFMVTFDHAEFKQVNQANSAMFAGDKLNLEEYVGLDDHTLHRIVLTLDMPIDPSKGGYPNAPFTANATIDMTLSGINQPQTIALPDGAKTVTDFVFPTPPALPATGQGTTLDVIVDAIGAKATYTYPFEAKAGDKVTITVSGLELEFDSQLTLLAPDGSTVAQNDDHDTPSFMLGDYESQIADFPIPKDGSYTIQLKEADGAAGSFILSIRTQR